MVKFQRKTCTKIHMDQSKYRSSYHSSCLIVMVLRGFDEDRKFGDSICGMKMLKQNTREKLEVSAQTTGIAAETVETLQLNYSYKAEEKSLNKKQTKSTK